MDIIDSANEIVNRDINIRIREILSKKPSGIESALECDNCDQPIPEKRRLAVPGCRLCVFCQAEVEKAMAL